MALDKGGKLPGQDRFLDPYFRLRRDFAGPVALFLSGFKDVAFGKFRERPPVVTIEQDGAKLLDQRIARIGARALVVERVDRNCVQLREEVRFRHTGFLDARRDFEFPLQAFDPPDQVLHPGFPIRSAEIKIAGYLRIRAFGLGPVIL